MSKIFKSLLALVLCLCLVISLCACSKGAKSISDIDQICVSGALYESYMHVVTDEDFVSEMVEFYNTLKFEETDESLDMMTAGKVYQFAYSTGNDTKAKLIVTEDGLCAFEAGSQSYKITSDFDFSHISELVRAQKG